MHISYFSYLHSKVAAKDGLNHYAYLAAPDIRPFNCSYGYSYLHFLDALFFYSKDAFTTDISYMQISYHCVFQSNCKWQKTGNFNYASNL